MSEGSILVRITKPIAASKRSIGLITVALIVIGTLGALYYFYIEGNKETYKEYRLQVLDNYYERVDAQFDNLVVSIDAQEKLETENDKNQAFSMEGILASNYDAVYHNMPWSERFDGFIVMHTQLSDSAVTWQVSDLVGNLEVNEDSLFAKAPFRSGTMIEKKINETNYRLFARKYRYDYGGKELADITLIGLVRSDRYLKETHRLDSWVISLLATLLLFCLFGLPLFKIVFLAEDEQLFGGDVLSAGITVLIGAPIIVIVFLAVCTYSQKYYLEVPDQLRTFAINIEDNFGEENEQIVKTLEGRDLDEIAERIKSHPEYADSAKLYFEGTTLAQLGKDDYKNFKFISSVNDSGHVDYHLNFIEAPEESTKDLSQRPYFKDFKSSSDVWRQGSGDKAIEYVMRPVISIEGQTEEAVYISRQKGSKNYAVGSVQLASLHDAILPLGYQFAVLNSEGNVWFHSKEGRAALENFWRVSKGYDEVKSAMSGRVEVDGMVSYHGENQLYCIRPIPNTSMSVIVLYDVSMLRLQVSEVLSIASFAILIAFLVASILALISAYAKSHRWRLSKYKNFAFDFLTPRIEKERDYLFLRKLFGVVILSTVVVSLINPFSPFMAFVTSMLLIVWSYVLVYYRLESQRLSGIAEVLSERNFALWKVDVAREWKSALKAIHLRDWLIFISLTMLNGVLCFLIGVCKELIYTLSAQAIFIVLFILSISHQWKRKNIPAATKASESFKFRYSTFLLSWLIITCILPALFYFSESWAVEDVIWKKYSQSYTAERYVEKREKLLKNLTPIDSEASDSNELWQWERYERHFEKGIYLLNDDEIHPFQTEDEEKPWQLGSESLFRKITWTLRPVYDKTIYKTQPWVFKNATDESWQSAKNDTALFGLHRVMGEASEEDRIVSFSRLNSRFLSDFSLPMLLVLVLGIIAIVALLYFIILFYVDRFFGFRFQHLRANDFDTNAREHYAEKFGLMLEGVALPSPADEEVQNSSKRHGNSGLMLIGLPFTGKRDFAIEVIKKSKFKGQHGFISCLDITTDGAKPQPKDSPRSSFEWMMDINVRDEHGEVLAEASWEERDVFVIENLEHDSRSVTGNRVKLKVISQLLTRQKRLIILSEVYPGQILAFFKEQVDAEGAVQEDVASDFASWRNILGEFPQVVLGMDTKSDTIEQIIHRFEASNNGARIDSEHKKSLIWELGHSRFLPTLTDTILSRNSYKRSNGSIAIDTERMILHTQNLAHGYYNDIWNSLAKRERYLLYDLATDGFMNIKNGDSLFSLMKKGLIVWNNRPAVFNNSFRNFIITSAGRVEALELENKNRKSGAWSSARIVIYLIILTLIGFLLLGEPSLVQDFKAFIGIIASIGAVLPIVSSALSGGAKK